MKIATSDTKCHAFARRQFRRLCEAATFCALLILFMAAVSNPACASQRIGIKILSSRPDVVSGGAALVQVTGPAEMKKLSIWADGRDVTTAFRVSPLTHTLIGLVDGLAVGKNRLEVKTGRKVRARLEIINHGITGPIFSGSHQTPFICQTESAGLGRALDADCSARTEVTYVYKSTEPPTPAERMAKRQPGDPPAGFKVYDPTGPRPG